MEPEHEKLPLTRQCESAGVPRSSAYRWMDIAGRQAHEAEDDLKLRAFIDAQYSSRPFYGGRRMVMFLRTVGHVVNRKRVRRLMGGIGLAGMAPGSNTSNAHPRHQVYPYRLRGVPGTRPNHVGLIDITYIRLARGFAYLVAIIDWYSRKVLSWRISNCMDASFCVGLAWRTPCVFVESRRCSTATKDRSTPV
jgi:putative transposase